MLKGCRLKILSIGNSFSQDAQRYLHRIAQGAGVELETANLYIGGCSLERHAANIHADAADYLLEQNGEGTGRMVSVAQALAMQEWDIVTLQQVSSLSWSFESYQPYLSELSEYVKARAPQAAQWVHQTWGYEDGSEKLATLPQFASRAQMYASVKNAYDSAAKAIGAAGIIPSGTAVELAYAAGGPRFYRDGFHAALGAGRYLLGCVWLVALTGTSALGSAFADTDEPLDAETRALLAQCAHEAVFNGR